MPFDPPFRFPSLLHGADYNYEQWLAYPEVLQADLELMGAAKISVLSVGIFAWSHLEPSEGVYHFDWLDQLMDTLAAREIRAILATPSGARPAWLSRRYPEVRRVDERGQREPHKSRHNHCRTSPIYRNKCRDMNTRLAERYADHPALFMWHVSNEYNAGPCHCALCYSAFRTWLQQRYGTLEKLNHAWWTSFWSHTYTSWEEIEPVDASVQGLMLDWQRFTSDQALDFFRCESAPLRELSPSVPVTTNFMQPDVGLDYWTFAPHVDVISWDSYPRWHQRGVSDAQTAARTAFYHDIHRSYKGQPFMLMESTPSVTNWQGISRPKRPGLHRLSSLQAVAHGSDTVQYFQWRQSRGGEETFHGAVVSHLGTSETRVFREVAEVGTELASLASVAGTDTDAQVALLYDFQSEWALNHAQLPQNEAKDYQACLREHHEAFWRQGVATDVVSPDHDFTPYRILVAPMLYLLRPRLAERLEAFVQGGGTLVTTHTSILVDQSGLALLGGFPAPLRRTLGLWVEETDSLYPNDKQKISGLPGSSYGLSGAYEGRDVADVLRLETAEALAVFDLEFYRGSAALTRNVHGEGDAFYMASRFDPALLCDFYAVLLDRRGVVRRTMPEGLSIVVRQDADSQTAFVMNFSDTTCEVSLTLDDGLPARKLMLEACGAQVLTLPRRTTIRGV